MSTNTQLQVPKSDNRARTLYFDENGTRIPAPIVRSTHAEGKGDIWRNIAVALTGRT